MGLDVAALQPDLILQPAPRAPEAVGHGKAHVGEALVEVRRPVDVDRSAARQRKVEADLEQAPGAMMTIGSLDDHVAGYDPPVEALERVDVLDDLPPQCRAGRRSLEARSPGCAHV